MGSIRIDRAITTLLLAGPVLLSQPSPEPSGVRLRVSVNLVQLDVAVTGPGGTPVAGLTTADFRVLLDGKPQPVVSCSFLEMERGAGPAAPLSVPPRRRLDATLPPGPVASIRREDVRRTVVLFVDDLSMSAESVPGVRNGLRRFIERQVQPGDLVAIVRASAGMGALQDFTPDRRLLLAAAGQVRWNPAGRSDAAAYRPFGKNPAEDDQIASRMGIEETASRINSYTVAVASSLRRVLHGMRDLPGRKSVVILSDNLPLRTPGEAGGGPEQDAPGPGGLILASMRRVVDESVRAGVVLYALDTRGLKSLTGNAGDNLRRGSSAPPGGPASTDLSTATAAAVSTGDSAWDALKGRRDEYREGQAGAMFLAEETGGFMVTEANLIEAGLERILNDQTSYYSIGFTPPPDALEPGPNGLPAYHRVQVEVVRPGLRVRSHRGFFGAGDKDRPAAAQEPRLELTAALETPFQSSGFGIEIQSGYLNERRKASFIRTAVFLNGHDLELTGPAIHRTGLIHLIVRAFGVSGDPLPGGFDQRLRIDVDPAGYDRVMKYGLIYTTLLPADKPGPYQVRVAVRDENNGKIGAASDFVEVPKLRSRLALSGLIFLRALVPEDQMVPASGAPDFAPGERAEFAFQLINVGKPPLTAWMLLLRDGVPVWQSDPTPLDTSRRRQSGRQFTTLALDIPAALEPGEYVMRVDVEDSQPAPNRAKACQWSRLKIAAR